METIGIGALAKRAGVRIDTVRYYERSGLLAPKARLATGYRRYGKVEVARLRFIRRAQALGFTLNEVRELLALSSRRDVARVKRVAQEKLADVERPDCRARAGTGGVISSDCGVSGSRPSDGLPDPQGSGWRAFP